MLPGLVLLSVAAFLASAKFSTAQYPGYYGKYIGRLKTLHHSLSGEVFAVDARTLHIRDFTYDGEGPAAFFYAGNSKVPSASGFKINDEKGSPQPLQKYVKKHVTITLPDSKTLHNIKWFSVWCDEFSVNFGDVKIPKNLDYPRPQKIDALNGVHLVSSDPIVVVDAQTLLIPNFSYDGEAPDAKFWVGRGNRPSPQGIRVPDENGKEVPLRRYDRKTIVLTLPGDLTVFDIGHFGVWCEAFTVDFGHIRIPPGLNVPPSLKMLGVAPQKRARSLELAPDQIRKQLVFGNPEQHSFGGGAPSGEHSFFNSHYNNGNTFYRDQQQLSSFAGSSTNLDKQFATGQQILATTYKPTFNLQRLHQQNQPELQQRQQPEIHTLFTSQAPTHQRNSSPSIEIVPSVSLSDSFIRESPPSQLTYNNVFQQPQDPRYYKNQQAQQQNAFPQTSPHHFNNQAINLQQQRQQQQQLQQQQLLQEQNRRNFVAESRVYANQVPNNHNNGRYFSRFSFHGPAGGQTFVQ